MDESLLFAIVESPKLNTKRISERVRGADYHGGGVIIDASTRIYLFIVEQTVHRNKIDAHYLQI